MSLEDLPGHAAVLRVWQECLREELPVVRTFLRPTAELARAYPKLGHRNPVPYEVVIHGPDDYEGFCRETGEIIPLSRQDLVVYEVDRRMLHRSVAKALGCRGMDELISSGSGVHQLGTWEAAPGYAVPMFLSTPCDARTLERLGLELKAEQDGPFLLLTPTARRRTRRFESTLRRAGAAWLVLCDGLVLADGGRFQATDSAKAVLRQLRGRITGHADEALYVFRRADDTWIACFEGVTKYLKPLAGHAYIARLLAQPGRELHVATLLASVQDDERVLADSSSSEVVDPESLRNYKRRIEELQEELAEAEGFHDVGRQEALCEELDALVCELARSTGLGGKSRQTGRAERIRKSVCIAISRSIEYIEGRHETLARHLQAHVDLGFQPSYRPPHAIEWKT